jgi:hypothetical protein
MTFDYYTGAQAEQFSFIRIPKLLLLHETFSPLSIQAKLLYAVLLDRMSLSVKNHWVDSKNRAYIIYPVEEIVQDLGFTRKKAMDVLAELETFGLVTKKRRGRGLPNYLYVMDFLSGVRRMQAGTFAEKTQDFRSAEAVTSLQTKPCARGAGNVTSRGDAGLEVPETAPPEVQESTFQEVQKTGPLKNKTYMNHTDMNQTERTNIVSYPVISGQTDQMRFDKTILSSDSDSLRSEIRERIGYADLIIRHPQDREMIDGMVELMLEVQLTGNPQMLVAGASFPTEMVQRRFEQLGQDHIEYVMECIDRNTTPVRNVKKYLLAALFNASSTMDSYYELLVRSDMADASAESAD